MTVIQDVGAGDMVIKGAIRRPPSPPEPSIPRLPPAYLEGWHCYVCASHFTCEWWHRITKGHRPQIIPLYES